MKILVVGAGLTGSVIANRLSEKGYDILLIDKRFHFGGNVYDEEIEGIRVDSFASDV